MNMNNNTSENYRLAKCDFEEAVAEWLDGDDVKMTDKVKTTGAAYKKAYDEEMES